MNGYLALYRGKQTEVRAETTLEAQGKAAEFFKARRRSDVSVYLAERADGSSVTQTITN